MSMPSRGPAKVSWGPVGRTTACYKSRLFAEGSGTGWAGTARVDLI
ncbi:hypothetical protein HLK59_23035 [Streptomyces sp. S3(2020)]|nr:hypothetical protein [Streptomyces sp. S3(2020)]NNN33180.1 hypothetical protein [Streptomyces sp. S3(2020)]